MISAETEEFSTSESTEEKILDIEELVKANLRPLPGTVTRILQLLQNRNVTHAEISEAIGYDPLLASRVMQLANSTLYALQRPVANISSALLAVGLRSVYDIVMMRVAADSLSDYRSIKTGVSIWEHSVAVALASRTLSQELGQRGTEEAFTCGLLHDIGKNLLFLADSKRFSEVEYAEDEDAASAMEVELFGFNHSQVGAYVSMRWGLAEEVSSTILAHHNPSRAREGIVVAHLVNVADELATMKGIGLHMEEPDSLPTSESTKALGLSNEMMESAWESVKTSLYEILAAYN